jgi:hypothetical protein
MEGHTRPAVQAIRFRIEADNGDPSARVLEILGSG